MALSHHRSLGSSGPFHREYQKNSTPPFSFGSPSHGTAGIGWLPLLFVLGLNAAKSQGRTDVHLNEGGQCPKPGFDVTTGQKNHTHDQTLVSLKYEGQTKYKGFPVNCVDADKRL